MNKNLAEYLTANGMKVEGNYAYGNLFGFETNVFYNIGDNISPVYLYISCFLTEEQRMRIQTDVSAVFDKWFHLWFTDYGVKLGFGGMTFGSIVKKMPQQLEKFFDIMNEAGVNGNDYCPVCGKEKSLGEVSSRNVEGALQIVMHDECATNINAAITRENQDFENAPNNYLKGFLGALVGGLVGSVVTIIIATLGYVSAWSAIIAVLLGAFLYKKFGGKPKKTMVAIVAATSLVCIMLTSVLMYVYMANVAAIENGLNLSAFEAFGACMEISEFATAFWTDFALSFVFTAVGIGLMIGDMLRSVKRNNNI